MFSPPSSGTFVDRKQQISIPVEKQIVGQNSKIGFLCGEHEILPAAGFD
jgi:hypothetical protein